MRDGESPGERRGPEDQMAEELSARPHLFARLAENTLVVAESLRDNYIRNTAHLVAVIRRAMDGAVKRGYPHPILTAHDIGPVDWGELQGEVVTFIDGGVGQLAFSSRMPLLLRVGSYCVRTGERDIAEREQFGYYPVILGDLEGGSKEREDYPHLVRVTAELLGGIAALERLPDLRVLMFHGPLMYPMGRYAGHTPFTEPDIDLFLDHYALDADLSCTIKEEFLREAQLDIYPLMAPSRCDEWVRRRLFEPLAWIAYLYRRLAGTARSRRPVPIIAGVVERSNSQEFLEGVLLENLFRAMRAQGRPDYLNRTFGRTDLTSPRTVLDRLGYTDAALLALLLRPGQFSEPWRMNKHAWLQRGAISLPGEAWTSDVDWGCLRPPSKVGFPAVTGFYVHTSENTEPIRVEVFGELGDGQVREAARRAYLYSRLLPGYGFPVGLDIADRHAHIPLWLTDAYSKLIRYHLGASLHRGEITDAEMRNLLVQAIYMTHRDWLFRPEL